MEKIKYCISLIMKRFLIFIVFDIFIFNCFAQQRFPLCYVQKDLQRGEFGNSSNIVQTFDCGFTNTERAYREIEKIMKLAGIPMNFTVCKTKKINNAYAALDPKGVRYIVYDDSFLKSFDSDSSRYETITALAHEIGHHLSGHTLSLSFQAYKADTAKFCVPESKNFDKTKCDDIKLKYLKESRIQELEADKFAGFIMNKYGASLQQIFSLYYKITSNYNDSLSTHPNLDKRLGAVRAGFELADLYNSANITYVDIEKIKGRKVEIEISDLTRINRNILVDKIRYCIISDAPLYVTNNIKGQELVTYTGGNYVNQDKIIQYIGTKENFYLIDKPDEYFILVNVFIGLRYDDKVSFRPQPAIHIKNGYLDIIVFGGNEPKVVYHVPFKEDKISLEEIKVIFIEIFRDGIMRQIEKI